MTGIDRPAATHEVGVLKVSAISQGKFKKFEPVSEGARRPVTRYLSRALLKSIRHTELHDLRNPFPEVLNDLSCDDYYGVVAELHDALELYSSLEGKFDAEDLEDTINRPHPFMRRFSTTAS